VEGERGGGLEVHRLTSDGAIARWWAGAMVSGQAAAARERSPRWLAPAHNRREDRRASAIA